MSDKMHEPLTEKYRPRRFADVVGQEEVVEELKGRVRDGNLSSVIALGPSGTGKTSLMRIFAHALHCEFPTPEPCGRCETCKVFANPDPRSWTFYQVEFSGAEHNDHASVKFIADLNQPRFFARRGFFVDEVHGLKPSAADALLTAIEKPGTGVFYTFATTDPEGVRPALRSRCDDLDFKLLDPAQSFGLLQTICDQEGFSADRDALEMLAVAGKGSARVIVKLLDRVSQQGDITPLLLQKALSLSWTTHLLAYFDALLSANIIGQEAAFSNWIAPASRKVQAIRDFMLYLHNYEVVRPRMSNVIDIAFHPLTASQRGPIVAGMRARAERSRMTLDAYWLGLMDWWNVDYRQIPDEEALLIRARRFNRVVNDEGAEVPDAVPPALIEKQQKRLVAKRSVRIDAAGQRITGVPNDRLTRKQAELIYDAATFLPQEYGVWFNASVQLRHGPLGATDPGSVAALHTTITHELPVRARAVANGKVHWASVHAAEEDGPVTYLLLHVPEAYLPQLRERIGQFLKAERGQAVFDGNAWPYEQSVTTNLQTQRNWHWRAVRDLWHGIDPAVQLMAEDGSRAPLLDLLGVPKFKRASIGEVLGGRRFSTSGTLAPGTRAAAARDRMDLLSAFADGAWSSITSGWELAEREDLTAEKARRIRAKTLVEAKWPVSENPLEQRRREGELAKLYASWPSDPHERRRSWTGWWS